MNACRSLYSVVVINPPKIKGNNNQHKIDKRRSAPQEKDTSRKVDDKCLRTSSNIWDQMWLHWNLLGLLHSGLSP
jgi:hypothetical protein